MQGNEYNLYMLERSVEDTTKSHMVLNALKCCVWISIGILGFGLSLFGMAGGSLAGAVSVSCGFVFFSFCADRGFKQLQNTNPIEVATEKPPEQSQASQSYFQIFKRFNIFSRQPRVISSTNNRSNEIKSRHLLKGKDLLEVDSHRSLPSNVLVGGGNDKRGIATKQEGITDKEKIHFN